ncbi:MAG: DUF393 domain-containing protein [Cyclobacteriaceae bacterium]|nr:DUF393 domain-containing protein [Cyclobacteriaceae bacterium]
MKPLTNHTLLYDQECPMCTAYSDAFVRCGLISEEGRKPYTNPGQQFQAVDWDRARNEIALVDHQQGTVRYGVDSVVTILAQRWPWLGLIANSRQVRKMLSILYFFISYNRKVMAPGNRFEAYHHCTPSMNKTYRWAYIIFAWMVTSLILVSYFRHFEPVIAPSGFMRETAICAGQILFQGLIVMALRKDRLLYYLGNLMTVSLVGAFALLPGLIAGRWLHTPYFFMGWFALVVAGMFFEHKRRVSVLELPQVVSYTWVLYRMLILFTVLI